jgi:hypothetical protein
MINFVGYVIYDLDQIAIYGTGATVDEAWQQVMSGCDRPLNAFDGEPVSDEAWFARFTVAPASAALIAQAESEGGDIEWGYLGGGACTVDELAMWEEMWERISP